GVGYIIAAFDPLRHWPIILVGLLGKILGPIGMANAVWLGRIPPIAGLVCATNDIIWWLPFGLILWATYRKHLAR
ncbi:MAG: alkyl hydroperoxide reductase, partial [Abditibacteriaceae bacterium]